MEPSLTDPTLTLSWLRANVWWTCYATIVPLLTISAKLVPFIVCTRNLVVVGFGRLGWFLGGTFEEAVLRGELPDKDLS